MSFDLSGVRPEMQGENIQKITEFDIILPFKLEVRNYKKAVPRYCTFGGCFRFMKIKCFEK